MRPFVILSLLLAVAPATLADDLDESVRAAVGEVAPSTVRIRTIGAPGQDNLPVSSSVTTGVVISDKREILTSVFGFSTGPAAVFVEDATGKRVAAKVVATDHVRKLVLLQCDDGQFTRATYSQKAWPSVGEWSAALGRLYPVADPATSLGIVSAVGRIHGLAIQTDAKISPVNYGGPLINLEGEVTGILVPLAPSDSGTQIRAGVQWYDSGIGFAIPIQEALQVAQTLRGREDRFHGLLGIRSSTRNPLAPKFIVADVVPGSPADKAGLRKGDVPVAANGNPIARFGLFDALVKSAYAGDTIRLKVRREEEEFEVEVTLVEQLPIPQRGFLGLTVDGPDGEEGKDGFGMKVFVWPGSPADTAGLPTSAKIIRWNKEEITKAADLNAPLSRVVEGVATEVGYVTADGEEKTVTLTAGPLPDELLSASDVIHANTVNGSGNLKWARGESDSGEKGKAWYYAPQTDEKFTSGLVVLLSEAATPVETVMHQWEELCRRNNLILLVPSTAEGTALTREDAAGFAAVMAGALKGRSISISRSVIVAARQQNELCAELLLNRRLRQIKAAVWLDCAPRLAGIPTAMLAAKSPAVLLLDGQSVSRQQQALRAAAAKQLKEAGVPVLRQSISDKGFMESIADWTIHLRAK